MSASSPGFYIVTAVSVCFLLTHDGQEHIFSVTDNLVTARRQANACAFSFIGSF